MPNEYGNSMFPLTFVVYKYFSGTAALNVPHKPGVKQYKMDVTIAIIVINSLLFGSLFPPFQPLMDSKAAYRKQTSKL